MEIDSHQLDSKRRYSKPSWTMVFGSISLITVMFLAWYFSPYLRARIRSIPLSPCQVLPHIPAVEHPDWVEVEIGKGMTVRLPSNLAGNRLASKTGRKTNVFYDRETKFGLLANAVDDPIADVRTLSNAFGIEHFNHSWASQYDVAHSAMALDSQEIRLSLPRNEVRKREYLLSWRKWMVETHTLRIYVEGENQFSRWQIMIQEKESFVDIYFPQQSVNGNVTLGAESPLNDDQKVRLLNDIANTARFKTEPDIGIK